MLAVANFECHSLGYILNCLHPATCDLLSILGNRHWSRTTVSYPLYQASRWQGKQLVTIITLLFIHLWNVVLYCACFVSEITQLSQSLECQSAGPQVKNIQPLTSSLTPMPKKLIRDVQIHTLLFKLRRGHDPLRAIIKFLVWMAFMILKIIWRD